MCRQYRQRPKRTITFENNYRPQLLAALGAKLTFADILGHQVSHYQRTGCYADFQSLNSGTALIETPAQATAYLAAYGHMHRLKLISAFDALFSRLKPNHQHLEVVDWGCGQGLASGVLLDYIGQHQLALTPARFTLIEPSALALSRAADHLSMLTNVPVRQLLHTADALPNGLLTTDPAKVKVHLFSNLLDMELVNYAMIARTIKTTQTGQNWFVCVSPAIIDFRNRRLREFRGLFTQPTTLSDRTDCFTGTVFSMGKKAYAPYLVKRTECLFTVQL